MHHAVHFRKPAIASMMSTLTGPTGELYRHGSRRPWTIAVGRRGLGLIGSLSRTRLHRGFARDCPGLGSAIVSHAIAHNW